MTRMQVAAALIAAPLLVGSSGIAVAEQPGAKPAAAHPVAAEADNALRRGAAPAAIAARAAERAQCREQAAKRRLFGLGRHKFLQRCRRARRKIAPTAPAPPPVTPR